MESVLSPTFLTTESDEYPSGNSGDGPIRASPPRHCGSDVRNVVLCSPGAQTVCAPYTKFLLTPLSDIYYFLRNACSIYTIQRRESESQGRGQFPGQQDPHRRARSHLLRLPKS